MELSSEEDSALEEAGSLEGSKEEEALEDGAGEEQLASKRATAKGKIRFMVAIIIAQFLLPVIG